MFVALAAYARFLLNSSPRYRVKFFQEIKLKYVTVSIVII